MLWFESHGFDKEPKTNKVFLTNYLHSKTRPKKTSVQFSSVAQSCPTLIAACHASLSITISRSSLRLTSIESVMPTSPLILGHPLLLLPPIPPSIRVFSRVNSSHDVAKVLEFSALASFLPKKTQGLIFFRMDWLDLLAVQGTLKSLLQHHSSKASILWCSAFFTAQLSHPYMTTGKTIALTLRGGYSACHRSC